MKSAYLRKHLTAIRRVKAVLAMLLALMILVDLLLVYLDKYDFPTFSWVIDEHQNEFIWLSFLYGGLVAKVYFNRTAAEKSKEVHGFLAFACMVFMLFLFGRIFEAHVEDLHLGYQLMLLAFGGYVTYRAWPQYTG